MEALGIVLVLSPRGHAGSPLTPAVCSSHFALAPVYPAPLDVESTIRQGPMGMGELDDGGRSRRERPTMDGKAAGSIGREHAERRNLDSRGRAPARRNGRRGRGLAGSIQGVPGSAMCLGS
jgi:hypothetical protein